ncbi:MAG: peptide deformylase [Myxococcota bacterium]
MAILKVAQVGHPVLRMQSQELTAEQLASPKVQQFMDDLLDTMAEYDGAGLAAPQVHTPLRIVVLSLTDERGPEFFVNPVITVLSDTTRRTWEGCLSVEGMRGLVERPDHVRVDALDRDGTPKTLEVQGFGAVVLQHECDHLDGVLYVDRILPRSLVTLREFRRWGPPDEFAGMEADVDDEGEFDDDLEELDEESDEESDPDSDTYDDDAIEAEV